MIMITHVRIYLRKTKKLIVLEINAEVPSQGEADAIRDEYIQKYSIPNALPDDEDSIAQVDLVVKPFERKHEKTEA